MKVSFIIVNYNACDYLIKCIDSIKKYITIENEIIVVDNNSPDHSVEALENKYPHIKIFVNDTNIGFSAANNLGMRNSTGEIIFLLNPDTEFIDLSLNAFFSTNNFSEKLIFAPKLLNSDKSLQISCAKFPGLFNVILETFYLHKLFNINHYPESRFRSSFEPDWASGAALIFSRRVYQVTGGLNPDLFWMDDVDFCKRAEEAGIPVRYIPELDIIHHGGKSSVNNLPVVIANQLISKIKYISLHHGKLAAITAALFIFVHIITRLIISAIFSFTTNARIKFNAYLFSLNKFFKYIAGDKLVAR